MPAPAHSAANYLSALQSLMPRGRIWPREPDATMTAVLSGLTPVYERQNARANALLVDAFPATAYELLPEWESTLGLPDPCAGASPTLAARRAQVVARLTGLGGQSVAYMIAYAANLGYAITITQFAPARVGQSRVGMPLNGPAWAHAWRVNSPLNTVRQSRVGSAAAGEPLASWGNAVLQCELGEIAPAHTTIIFAYT
ncbi:MAG TPA: putative phage tail protein [Patescibacteria group bacterium]|nr:putative phage tail protein [Patescibacteria group bacterium]